MPGGHRPRSATARSRGSRSSRGWPACVFFVGLQAAGTACSATSISCSSCRELLLLLSPSTASRRCRAAPEREPMTCGRSSRRSGSSSFALLVVGGRSAGSSSYKRFFREEPAPYFASDEEHFLFGSVGTEAEQGAAVLDLARAAADLPGAPARARRLRLARHSSPATATRCRSACRRSPSGSRASASTARCATRPASARGRAGRADASSPARRVAPDGASSSTCASCSRCASDPRFTADTHPRARSRRTRGCRSSIACSTGSRSFPRHAAGAAAAARRARPGCARGPTGAAAASTRSTR